MQPARRSDQPWRAPALALALALLLQACIPIPISYTPEATVQEATPPDSDTVQLTIGPRQFLDTLTQEIARNDKRLVVRDRLAVRDQLFADGDWRMSRLLGGAAQEFPSAEADFVVVAGATSIEYKSTVWIPAYVLAAGKNKSDLSAFVFDVDAHRFQAGFRAHSEAAYGGAGYVIVIMTMPDTNKAVLQALGRAVANAMLLARPQGTIGFVVMSAETPRPRVDHPRDD